LTSENQPLNQPAHKRPGIGLSALGAAGLLMIGAAVIVAGHLLFGLIMGDFTYGSTNVAVSLLILLGILGKGSFGGATTQRLLGLFLGLSAAVSLLSDIRFGFPDGFVDNVANLTCYAGAGLAFLGSFTLKD